LAPRFETTVAVRVPSAVERELRRRAKEDDRPLSSFLRRELIRLAALAVAQPQTRTESDSEDGHA
jgi:hypothetical protein